MSKKFIQSGKDIIVTTMNRNSCMWLHTYGHQLIRLLNLAGFLWPRSGCSPLSEVWIHTGSRRNPNEWPWQKGNDQNPAGRPICPWGGGEKSDSSVGRKFSVLYQCVYSQLSCMACALFLQSTSGEGIVFVLSVHQKRWMFYQRTLAPVVYFTVYISIMARPVS